jgi:hypothetical protein
MKFAAFDHVIDLFAEPCPFSQTEPADTRRQALEAHLFPSLHYPSAQFAIMREHLQHDIIDGIDIFRVAQQ